MSWPLRRKIVPMVDSGSRSGGPGALGSHARRQAGLRSGELQALAARLASGLQLQQALTFVDLETTGLDVLTDRIVEVAMVRIEPAGSARSFTTLINPEVSIPAAAAEVHGITNDDVVDAPTFVDVADTMWTWLAGSDIGGYNVARFDLPMLQAELERAGRDIDWATIRVVDACAVFKRMERRDLAAAYRFYCAAELEAAHAAGADVRATMEIMLGQLEHYPQLRSDVVSLDAIWRPRVESDT